MSYLPEDKKNEAKTPAPESEVKATTSEKTTQDAEQNKSTLSDDSKLMAALSYLWILSIVIFLVKKDDEFVTFHAQQAVVLFGISIALWFLIFIPLVNLLLPIIWLGYLVLIVFGAVKAYQGERYAFPVISEWAKKVKF